MRAFALLLLAAVPAFATEVTKKFETVKVAEGIYAFIAPEPRSGVVNGNVVAVIGDDGVLVVDTGQFPELAKKMVAEIRAKTNQPVRYVVNTHWHWDHNLANHVFRDAYPNAAIVSTAFTRKGLVDWTPPFQEFLRTSGPKMVERMKAARDNAKSDDVKEALTAEIEDFEAGMPEVGKATFVAPNQTFEKEMTVYLGKREVRIFHPGRANTAGDVVVYVPDAKVLITGDIVVYPTPYATHAYFREWVDVMKMLSAMDTVAIVPGHGPVQRDKRYMQQVTALLESLVTQVQQAVARGLTLEETKKKVDLSSFRTQFTGGIRKRERAFDDYFLSAAVTDAWKQAKGEPTSEAPF